MPKAWRGAALQDGSSIGCQQAAPGNDSAQGFAHRVCFVEGIQRPIELPHVETFPGAACCQVTELTRGKAAPLQAVGSATMIWSAGWRSFPLPKRVNEESHSYQEHKER